MAMTAEQVAAYQAGIDELNNRISRIVSNHLPDLAFVLRHHATTLPGGAAVFPGTNAVDAAEALRAAILADVNAMLAVVQ